VDLAGIQPSAKLWHHVVGPSKYGLIPICYLLFVASRMFGAQQIWVDAHLSFVVYGTKFLWAQQTWVNVYLSFAVCGTKNKPNRGRIAHCLQVTELTLRELL
jgi:hypothetical protein